MSGRPFSEYTEELVKLLRDVQSVRHVSRGKLDAADMNVVKPQEHRLDEYKSPWHF